MPFGYWEPKDSDDDLDEEIEKKFRRGYPQDNIIFEDSREAVLIQNKQQVMRCGVEDVAQLKSLLERIFDKQPKHIYEENNAIQNIKSDIKRVLGSLRHKMEKT